MWDTYRWITANGDRFFSTREEGVPMEEHVGEALLVTMGQYSIESAYNGGSLSEVNDRNSKRYGRLVVAKNWSFEHSKFLDVDEYRHD